MTIAILRLDALGDNLLSTPSIVRLKQGLPQAEPVVFTHRVCAPVFRQLAEVQIVEPQHSSLEIAERLIELKPQAVLVYSEKRRAGEAARRSGCGLRLGFDPGWSQPLKSLWTRVGFHHRVATQNSLKSTSGCHEVERYCALVDRLLEIRGVNLEALQPPPKIWFPIAAKVQENADGRLAQLGLERPVGLQVTPKFSLHGWGPQQLRELFGRLPEPRLLFYGPGEVQWVEQYLADLAPSYCSQDLEEYGAMLARCRVLITPDTGAVHVASGVGTPVVDIFPSQNWEHCTPRWRPWQVDHRLLASGNSVGLVEKICSAIQEFP